MKIIIAFLITILAISSCRQSDYYDTYGAQVPPGVPPYSFGQVIKFENGNGDTITFRCIKHENEEYVNKSPCTQYDNDCYIRDHNYRMLVDLQDLDDTRIFKLKGSSNGVSLDQYINKLPIFRDSANTGNIPFPDSPGWLDSIKLNNKTFYTYSMQIRVGWTIANPIYTDTIMYSKQDGIIMFSSQYSPQNAFERWVLVK